MSGFSGKFATAKYIDKRTDADGDDGAPGPETDFVEMTGWDFEPKSAIPKWASNDTDGFKTGVAGVEDSSGKIDCKLDKDGRFTLKPGKKVLLKLYANKHRPNDRIEVLAIIGNTPISMKIDPDGEPGTVTLNWEGIRRPVYFGFFRAVEDTGSSGIS